MVQLVEQSADALHHFFEEWFGGTIANTIENFQFLEKALSDDFKIVTPNGALQNREQVITEIREGWGTMSGIKIWIENVILLHEDNTSILVLYTEHQSIKEALNSRISTAFFNKHLERLSWAFVQETFVKDKN